MTLARGLLVCLVLILVAGAVGVWIVGVPYLERRWTYRVVKETPDAPWQTPKGAEKVTFLAADDVRLRGWFFPAAARPNGMTVLVLPGNYGTLPGYVSHCRYLQERGFNLLLFNYRGFGMSEGDTESEATLTLDAEAAMHYLTAKRGIASDDIVIAGISLGAPVAATLAARSPCRAVTLISTVASARTQAAAEIPWLPQVVLDNLPSPFDAEGSIGLARCPVVVIHGVDDDVVPLAQARQVYDAAGPPKRFIEVPTADHGLMGVPPESYLDSLVSFLVDGR
jgi:pimeloyl-ACP methyl ester carboxylesterase